MTLAKITRRGLGLLAFVFAATAVAFALLSERAGRPEEGPSAGDPEHSDQAALRGGASGDAASSTGERTSLENRDWLHANIRLEAREPLSARVILLRSVDNQWQEIVRTDDHGRIRAFVPSLTLEAYYLSIYPPGDRHALVCRETGSPEWPATMASTGITLELIAPALLGAKVLAGARYHRSPYRVRDAGSDITSSMVSPLVDIKALHNIGVTSLTFSTDYGDISLELEDARTDAENDILLTPPVHGAIRVRCDPRAGKEWHAVARREDALPSEVPGRGLKATIDGEGWLFSQLPPGDYYLEWWVPGKGMSTRFEHPTVITVHANRTTVVDFNPTLRREWTVVVTNWSHPSVLCQPKSLQIGLTNIALDPDTGLGHLAIPDLVRSSQATLFYGDSVGGPVDAPTQWDDAHSLVQVRIPSRHELRSYRVDPLLGGAVRMGYYKRGLGNPRLWNTVMLRDQEGMSWFALSLRSPILVVEWLDGLRAPVCRGWILPQEAVLDSNSQIPETHVSLPGRWVTVRSTQQSGYSIHILGPGSPMPSDMVVDLSKAHIDNQKFWLPDSAIGILVDSGSDSPKRVSAHDIGSVLVVQPR